MRMLRPWIGRDHLDLTEQLLRDVEPWLRAFTHIDLVAARASAAASSGPLAGMPVAVKEIIDVAGMPITYGSRVHAGRTPKVDALAVSRLRRAGAVLVGTTTTTPFACGTTTVTANPHARSHTPGGSSAGSGAAVGAGIVPVALASQSQASTIRPASYCGAWGFKPSHERLPRGGMHLLAPTLDDLGVMAASVADLDAVLEVLADTWTPRHVTDVRVGVVRLDDGDLPSPSTRAALDALIDRLAGESVEIVRADPDLSRYDALIQGSGRTCFDIFAGESAQGLAQAVRRGEPDPRLTEMIGHARQIGADGLAAARARRSQLRASHAALQGHVDVLLTLSTTNPAPVGHASTGCRRMPATASLLGVPAVSAPWLTVDGMPQGVQLIGFEGHDEHLMAVVRHLAAREKESR